jgi:FHA domain
MVELLVESGPRRGERLQVIQELILGRTGDVAFDDAEASRRHVAVRPTAGGVEIEDLGSTNGTYVNDGRIAGRTVASVGDVVRFAGTSFRIVDAVEATAAHVRAPEVPAAAAPGVPAAAPPSTSFAPPARRRTKISSRSPVATVLSVAVIVATSVAVVLYFLNR